MHATVSGTILINVTKHDNHIVVNSTATRSKLASKKTWQNRDPADAGVGVGVDAEGDVGDDGVGVVVGGMGDDRSSLQTFGSSSGLQILGIK